MANVFVMASPKLQTAEHSPPFRYLRTLELGAWRRYLSGADYFGGVRGLLVYYWRGAPGAPIDANNPFRLYLDMNRSASAVWWMQILRVVVGVSIAVLLLGTSRHSLHSVGGFAKLHTSALLTLLGVTGLLSLLALASKIRSFTADRFLAPRRWARGPSASFFE